MMKNARGASMVEFAVVLPFLITVLFGLIQYGYLFAAYITVKNASAVGARCAITTGCPSVVNTTQQAVQPLLNPANASVTFNSNYLITGTTYGKRVDVTYPLPLFVRFLVPGSVGGNFTLRATTISR